MSAIFIEIILSTLVRKSSCSSKRMKTAQKNSDAAAQYAKKKQDQMEKARRLKAERESKSSSSAGRHQVMGGMSTGYDLVASTQSSAGLASMYQDLEQPTMQPFAEHIKISKSNFEYVDADKYRELSRERTERKSCKPMSRAMLNSGPDAPPHVVSSYVSGEGFDISHPRTGNTPHADSRLFTSPPADAQGTLVDVSDRPLLCMSSNKRNEVVVGSSDHALYAIDLRTLHTGRKPITMYSKKYGHTDWITSVTHLANGKVLSSSMDGKLCLWDTGRRECRDLFGHEGSVTKVISDESSNTAISLGYDGNVLVWNFDETSVSATATPTVSAYDQSQRRRNVTCRSAGTPSTSYSPLCILSGHNSPVLECTYISSSRRRVLASGAKDGGLFLWEADSGAIIARYRAHKSPVTAMECVPSSGLFLTGGADGFVKVWDSRERNAVQRIPAHTHKNDAESGHNSSANSRSAFSAAVSCIGCVGSGVGGSDIGYVVTGGADSIVAVTDVRGGTGNYSVVDRHAHHTNGIYSLCAVGNGCVLSGDGQGMMMVYDITQSGREALRYGLGASSSGAVRAIACLDGKIVACGEDGNVIVFSY